MPHEEIVTRLSLRFVNVAADPTQIVYAVTLQAVLSELAHRLGEKALTLSLNEILTVRDAVRSSIAHWFDERQFVTIGVETWASRRNL